MVPTLRCMWCKCSWAATSDQVHEPVECDGCKLADRLAEALRECAAGLDLMVVLEAMRPSPMQERARAALAAWEAAR